MGGGVFAKDTWEGYSEILNYSMGMSSPCRKAEVNIADRLRNSVTPKTEATSLCKFLWKGKAFSPRVLPRKSILTVPCNHPWGPSRERCVCVGRDMSVVRKSSFVKGAFSRCSAAVTSECVYWGRGLPRRNFLVQNA